MKPKILLAALLLGAGSAWAQAPAPPATLTTAQQKLKPAHWLVGQWRGQGWMMDPQGKKHAFTQYENIQLRVKNSVLQIEGIGTAGPDTVHHAMAMLSYNAATNQYSFNSYTRGMHTAATAEVQDKKLIWQMQLPNNGLIRYTIVQDDKGQWVEVGERSANGGQAWAKFFEMTLIRTNSTATVSK